MKRFIAFSIATVALTGCSWLQEEAPAPSAEGTQESSVTETHNVLYRGTVERLGASIFMEGTHRLNLEDGRFILLESSDVSLDDFLGSEVEAHGSSRSTVEGSAIILRVKAITEASVHSSSSSSSETLFSSTTSSAPSSAVIVKSAAASKAAPAVSSSARPSATPVSSTVSASSAVGDELAAKAATMTKANLAPANWTLKYCSPAHLSFCFPVHKNWWFNSFGATSSSQWHVEVGPEELEELGDGPISIVLLSGAASVPDGSVSVSGGSVIGTRIWSNGRHFEIRAPASLEAAVRFITAEIHAAPGVGE